MKLEAGRTYVTRCGLATTKLRRLDHAGSLLKWSAEVSGQSCWWLEDGSYAADGSHANDLVAESGAIITPPEPAFVRALVGDPDPQWVKEQLAAFEARRPVLRAEPEKPRLEEPSPEKPKPECPLDLISGKLAEMVVMCDEALEFNPLDDVP